LPVMLISSFSTKSANGTAASSGVTAGMSQCSMKVEINTPPIFS
jgi:hypothetical protein